MKVYMFQAALWCPDCAAEICRARPKPPGYEPCNEHTWDSDDYPKGPFSDGGGEADVPQHCDGCGVFLENPLTTDGADYVRAALTFNRGHSDVLNTWREFYDWI